MNRNISHTKKKKIIAFLIFAAIIAAVAAVGLFIGKKLIEYAAEPEQFRNWVNANGFVSRLVYIAATALQVIIAFIPGEPLEILGGYAFGAAEGTFLCMTAASIGSVIVFLLVRRFGMRFVEIFFSKEKIQSLNFLKSSPKNIFIFFIIFTLPGTPKDILSYFAGLTEMKLSQWLFICIIGRIPSVITSTVGGSAIGNQNYTFAVIVFAATILLSGLGIMIYNKISKKRQNDKDTEKDTM